MGIDATIPLRGKTFDLSESVGIFQDRKRQKRLDELGEEDRQFRRDSTTRSQDLQERGLDERVKDREFSRDISSKRFGLEAQRLEIAKQNATSQDELRQIQIDNAEFDGMQSREQARVRNTVIPAAELKAILDTGNIDNAKSYLTKRRAALGKQIANGEDVDTKDTDEALAMLDSNPNDLLDLMNGYVQFGERVGILDASEGAGVGGATGELIDRLMSENPDLTQAQALGLIKGGAGSRARLNSQIDLGREAAKEKKSGELDAKLELEPAVASAVEVAKIVAKEKGEALASLDAQTASFPKLQEAVISLRRLGQKATFTKAGQTRDSILRQAGLPVGEGAVARTAYIATVANEVLPLLRQTFGAAFTEKEGESLKSTLGDPDKSPAEKEAVLKAFISQKASQIEALKRQTGQQETPQTIDFNDLPE